MNIYSLVNVYFKYCNAFVSYYMTKLFTRWRYVGTVLASRAHILCKTTPKLQLILANLCGQGRVPYLIEMLRWFLCGLPECNTQYGS